MSLAARIRDALLFPPIPVSSQMRCADRGGHRFIELPYGSLNGSYRDWPRLGADFWKDEYCLDCGDTRRVRRDCDWGYA